MKLSIVTTLYRSTATVNEFYSRAMKAAEAVADDIELLIVNDGSPDALSNRPLPRNLVTVRPITSKRWFGLATANSPFPIFGRSRAFVRTRLSSRNFPTPLQLVHAQRRLQSGCETMACSRSSGTI
jgi:hypothetical protein